jgi:hypothetical protein
MKKEIIQCDICGDDKNSIKQKQSVSVIFTTEQNEGRATTPYLDIHLLDLCADCYGKVLEGKAIFATGAMGYNKYYLSKPI